VAQVEIAADMVAADLPFVSLQQGYALLLEQAPTITLAEVNASLKTRFRDKPDLLYRGSTPPPGGEAALRAAFNKAWTAPVTAYVPEGVKPWPYASFGEPGVVKSREYVADLDVTLVEFENGVKLTVKPMPSNKDLVNIRVRIGRGRLQMPMNVIDASDMGLSLWSSGGLGKLTVTEQGRTLAGKRVGVVARTLDDAYSLENFNMAPRDEFGLQMELMTAMLSDPAYRADDWATWMSQADAVDASMLMTPSGVLERELDRLVHGDDLRWTINTSEMRKSWKPEDSVKYIKPIVDNSPIEVIVVGDIRPDAVIAEVARTMGALPPRPPFKEPSDWRDVDFPKPGTTTLPHEGRADQGYALIGWPTYQGAFKVDPRRAHRLRPRPDAARQRHPPSSAPRAAPPTLRWRSVDFSTFLPDYGYIAVAVEAPPELIDDVQTEIQRIATGPRHRSPVPQGGDRPRRRSRRSSSPAATRPTSVGYWTELLGNVARRPKRPRVHPHRRATHYASITPADVQAGREEVAQAGDGMAVESDAERVGRSCLPQLQRNWGRLIADEVSQTETSRRPPPPPKPQTASAPASSRPAASTSPAPCVVAPPSCATIPERSQRTTSEAVTRKRTRRHRASPRTPRLPASRSLKKREVRVAVRGEHRDAARARTRRPQPSMDRPERQAFARRITHRQHARRPSEGNDNRAAGVKSAHGQGRAAFARRDLRAPRRLPSEPAPPAPWPESTAAWSGDQSRPPISRAMAVRERGEACRHAFGFGAGAGVSFVARKASVRMNQSLISNLP
jgi:hypothetical protein